MNDICQARLLELWQPTIHLNKEQLGGKREKFGTGLSSTVARSQVSGKLIANGAVVQCLNSRSAELMLGQALKSTLRKPLNRVIGYPQFKEKARSRCQKASSKWQAKHQSSTLPKLIASQKVWVESLSMMLDAKNLYSKNKMTLAHGGFKWGTVRLDLIENITCFQSSPESGA